jgi:hypothetical protein
VPASLTSCAEFAADSKYAVLKYMVQGSCATAWYLLQTVCNLPCQGWTAKSAKIIG